MGLARAGCVSAKEAPVGMDRWAVPALPNGAKERGRWWSASNGKPLRELPMEGDESGKHENRKKTGKGEGKR